MDFAGKVAIVTGASRGIGKATAIALAQAGASVVVAARTEQERGRIPGTIHQTVADITAAGGHALALRADVADEDSVADMVRRTIAEFGQVDILINNAAGAYYKPLAETPAQRWDLVVNVNLRGTFLCSRAVLAHMIGRRAGSIVNISSRAADHGIGTFTGVAYCATKAAVERFTSALAEEVRTHNVAVNAIKPRGAVLTEGMRLQNPDADYSDWDRPEDFMVKGILFLAAQDASGVTGSVFIDDELCRRYEL
jgi:NAD(P)-dependent dehydrogenase (short-subunit alcohol dehydrogenase family)